MIQSMMIKSKMIKRSKANESKMKQNNNNKKKKKYTMIKKAVSNLKINGNTHVISHNLDPQ